MNKGTNRKKTDKNNKFKIFEKFEFNHLKNHPVKRYGLEKRIYYIRGLGLFLTVNKKNNEKKQSFMKCLVNCINLPDIIFKEVSASKEVMFDINEFIEIFSKNYTLKIAFMIDAVILTKQSKIISEKETRMINTFATHLAISANQMKEIRRKAEKNDYFPCAEGLILVKGGNFLMGNDKEFSDENTTPVHKVTLNSFYIGKYPVTQREYSDITGHNPSSNQSDNHPVETVSWFDAVIYCNKKSKKEGFVKYYKITKAVKNTSGSVIKAIVSIRGGCGYRLPTEAEWEYAANGGKEKRAFKYSGANNLDTVAWYAGNSKEQTHCVGKKRPNKLGIYDMSGNVFEWCWDPLGGKKRIVRGGSCLNPSTLCQITYRESELPKNVCIDVGFRLARKIYCPKPENS